MKRIAISILVLTCGSASADSRPPVAASKVPFPFTPAGATVLKSNQGVPDNSGWVKATSKIGMFSVSLPCKYYEMTYEKKQAARRYKNKEISLESSNILACRNDKIDTEVYRISYSNSNAGQNSAFGEASKIGLKLGGKVDNFLYVGMPAVQIDVYDSGGCNSSRYIRFKEDLILMTFMTDGTTCESRASEAKKFFNSLEILDK